MNTNEIVPEVYEDGPYWACAKCWNDARKLRTQWERTATAYYRLLEERADDPCSPEDQEWSFL